MAYRSTTRRTDIPRQWTRWITCVNIRRRSSQVKLAILLLVFLWLINILRRADIRADGSRSLRELLLSPLPKQEETNLPPILAPTQLQYRDILLESDKNKTLPLVFDTLTPNRTNAETVSEGHNQTFNFKEPVWFYDQLSTADIWNPANGDRILEQLAHMPALVQNRPEVLTGKPKLILDLTGARRSVDLISLGCPVYNCKYSRDTRDAPVADAVVMRRMPAIQKFPGQVWVFKELESPYHSAAFPEMYKNIINWTATYRLDSTLVAPYEKFVPYDPQVRFINQSKNYAERKTKKVAWFVSNCGARSNRMQYAKELGKYITVDIYGRCGTLHCPRYSSRCFQNLSKYYKFYLAFENSNCKGYITEKLFWNGLGNDVVPIALGAPKEDYLKVAPPHSIIHVDDFASPKDLAAYLHYLDKNHTAYNEYFLWKGTGKFINTKFACRLCSMLHESTASTIIPDINEWWRGRDVCNSRR